MVDFVSHGGLQLNLTPFFFDKSVRFRVKDPNEHLLVYIKDHFNQVRYIKDQNKVTPVHQGPF